MWLDAESPAGALVIREVATMRAAGERADELFADARAELAESGVDYKSVLLDLFDASRKLGQGDLAAVGATVDEVGAFLRERWDSIPGYALRGISAAWGLLRAGLAARSGDPNADTIL